MTATWLEHAASLFEPVVPKWATPGAMAQALDPKTVQTPALDLIDAALVEAFTTPDARLIISMPPQEGKSQRASRRFPLWVLTQNPHTRVTIASYETGVARRWGRSIRDDIATHSKELGLRVRDDVAAQGEWMLEGAEGGVFTAGIGSALTGRPSDLMIIDDPIKNREQADSITYRERAYDWWLETAQTRLAPGAPVILILTRWHQDDLAGRVLADEGGQDWQVINIPAEADHRPEKGETDILGRQPGVFMESARGRTRGQWLRRKRDSGARTWASLYQGRPSPDAGGVYPAEWARYNERFWIEHPDGRRTVPGIGRDDHELVQSWDLAFKDTKSSDYVVGQVWLRIGVKAYLLDQVRDRLNFTASCDAIKAMSAKWPQAIGKFVEDKANGPAVMNALASQVIGMIPIEPEGSKYARASAVSPLVESGNVVLPESHILPNVDELLEEARNFPNASHDDTVDAMSQAINRLLLMPLQAGMDDVVEPDEYDFQNAHGWSISPV